MCTFSGILIPVAVFAVLLEPAPAERDLLDAIRFVESGDRVSPPDGDGGLSIGPYQISHAYWQDAVEFAPEIGGEYDMCRDGNYAERIVRAYMQRYARDAWERFDFEFIARTHNGGPRGASRDVTLAYWRKVKARLEARSRQSPPRDWKTIPSPDDESLASTEVDLDARSDRVGRDE